MGPEIEAFGIESFNFERNRISDVTPLAGLANLEELHLNGTNLLSDISPLSGLTNLRGLTLWRNQISDISPLSGLTNLEWLSLDYNPITDWTPVDHVELVGGRP